MKKLTERELREQEYLNSEKDIFDGAKWLAWIVILVIIAVGVMAYIY